MRKAHFRFLTLFNIIFFKETMSRIQRTPIAAIIEPEVFEEQVLVSYSPQHPALAYHAELKAFTTPDHLDNYVEVQPLENRQKK